jgi:predicted transcriptional regulator of viral defense system
VSLVAARAAIRRVRDKGRIATPFKGFHVIVPPEYRCLGCLPADQFIPDLMEHLGLTCYVGLLSAAALHGAAHQAPMVFHVVVADNRPEILCGRVRVEFIARRNVSEVTVERRNTPRGFLTLSTAEATAFDLVGYADRAGGLSNVATVLSELAEVLRAERILMEAEHSPVPWAQRLGFLLDLVGFGELTGPLAEHIAGTAREYVPLRIRWPASGARLVPRWKILLNEDVEPDL